MRKEMDSKTFLPLFLLISSWVYVGFCQSGGGGGGGGDSLPCIQKLMPCQPYLKSPTPPPPTCCIPLKEMISGDSACLCQIFNNADLLKQFNVTKDDALKFPKACGANADITLCKNDSAAPPSGSPAIPSNSTSPSNTTTAKKSTGANCIAYFGGSSSFILFIVGLVLLAVI